MLEAPGPGLAFHMKVDPACPLEAVALGQQGEMFRGRRRSGEQEAHHRKEDQKAPNESGRHVHLVVRGRGLECEEV